MAKNELLWWVKNLQLCNGRIGSTTTGTGPYSDKCIEKRLGGCTSRDQNRGQWSKKEQDLHINQLELLAIKFTILTLGTCGKCQLYISR